MRSCVCGREEQSIIGYEYRKGIGEVSVVRVVESARHNENPSRSHSRQGL